MQGGGAQPPRGKGEKSRQVAEKERGRERGAAEFRVLSAGQGAGEGTPGGGAAARAAVGRRGRLPPRASADRTG